MATTYSAYIQPVNSPVQWFRAWAQFIKDTFDAGGWVQTADSGQADIATMAIPTGSYQKKGYLIYRMNDTLQAIAPVFVRLDFGSNGNAGQPGLWVQFGTGSDGAGAITGALNTGSYPPSQAQPWPAMASNFDAAPNRVARSYGSADTNRVALAMFQEDAGEQWGMLCGIERLKDSNGADTPDGIHWVVSRTNTYIEWTFRFGPVPPSSPTTTPTFLVDPTAGAPTGRRVGVGAELGWSRTLLTEPLANYLFVRPDHWSRQSGRYIVHRKGETRIYQGLGGRIVTNAVMWMRYD